MMGAVVDRLVKQSKLALSNLDKVLFPATGTTKGAMIEYYYAIAPTILAHLREHPITMKRYPDGVAGEFFYEKRCPAWRPPWAKTCAVRRDGSSGEINYCTVADVPSLLWMANLGSIELHPLLGTCRRPDRPTALVFDLDPGAPAGLLDCVWIARELRAMLRALGLEAVPKTSGGKGLHLWVPLNTNVTFDQTKEFAHAVALLMEREHPKLVTATMRRSERAGKVFIDWSQNDRSKTTVAAYSVRAMPQPTVSTPLHWDEIDAVRTRRDVARLTFDIDDVPQRLREHGDLFADVRTMKQRLPGDTVRRRAA
jgi:bifunctional non-homologous end joining protein LigD